MIKRYILLALICFGSMGLNAQSLPREWTKDFVITLHFKSAMSGGFTDVRFTYDSCIYKNAAQHSKPTATKTYLLKDADRADILKKLHELKADEIKSKNSLRPVNDGWSQSLCIGTYCIEGGSSSEMDESNKNRFLDAYRYLEEFAMKKGKKTK